MQGPGRHILKIQIYLYERVRIPSNSAFIPVFEVVSPFLSVLDEKFVVDVVDGDGAETLHRALPQQ